MVLACVSSFPKEEGVFIQTVVLAGIFIFELIGPVLVKYVFKKTNEIHAENENVPVLTEEKPTIEENKE